MPEPKVVEDRLSPAELTDLDAIWDYTAHIWFIIQAEVYIRGLAADMALLVQHPGIARERIEILPPVRLLRSGSHLIIYRIEAGWLVVLRIVRAQQNWVEFTPSTELRGPANQCSHRHIPGIANVAVHKSAINSLGIVCLLF